MTSEDKVRRHWAQLRYERALELEEQGLVSEAIGELRAAVELNPLDAESLNVLGYLLGQQGKPDEALQTFRRAVAVDNNHLGACINLGMALADRREYNEALTWLRRARRILPELALVHREIAAIHRNRWELKKAVKSWQRALELEPNAATYESMADCCLLLRWDDEAEQHYREALKLSGSVAEATQIRRKLDAMPRVREFPAGHKLGIKDRTYCNHQTVLLGCWLDDGLDINEYFFFNLDYSDVASILRRFLALHAHFRWPFTAVTAVDEPSVPLALAMTKLLSLPTRAADELSAQDMPLIVQAIGLEASPLREAAAHTPGRCLTFCLAMSSEADWIPDVAGVITPLESTVPWRRTTLLSCQQFHNLCHPADEEIAGKPNIAVTPPFIDERPPQEIAADILDAVATLPDWETNLAAQVDYYTQQHPHLRFLQEP